MSCTACSCNLTLSNTGFGCTPIMQVAYKLIAVPIYDNDGNKNGIAFSSTLNQSFINGKLVDTEDKRWYPYPSMKNVDDTREDNIYETFDDQTQALTQQGVRKFKALITPLDGNGATAPQMKTIIETARCGDIGYYYVDLVGNLIGKISSDGLSLQPIAIDTQSLTAKFIKTKNKEVQKLELTFQYKVSEQDADLRMIACDEWGGADLLGISGLIDVTAVYTNITSTSLTVELLTDFGTPISPVHLVGLTIDDFLSPDSSASDKIYNVTDLADVTLTSVTETGTDTGIYDLVYPAQTVGDILRVWVYKQGYETDSMLTQNITIAVS